MKKCGWPSRLTLLAVSMAKWLKKYVMKGNKYSINTIYNDIMIAIVKYQCLWLENDNTMKGVNSSNAKYIF